MNILIIGAGFVGLHLFHLLKEEHDVTCTVRSLEKQKSYLSQGIKTKIFDSKELETYLPCLHQQEIIVVAVAANDQNYESTYLDLAKNIASMTTHLDKLKHLIILSSTSVYQEALGEVVDENSPLNREEDKPRILVDTEKTYLNLSNVRTCILRLGEIYGGERSLEKKIRHLASKEIPGDGNQFSNLIHVDDIVQAIDFVIRKKLNGIYNLVCDDHLKRKELYQLLSHQYHCQMPVFNPLLRSHHGKNKIVSNQKIKQTGFELKHPHLLL